MIVDGLEEAMDAGIAGGRAEPGEAPHVPVRQLAADEFGLTAEDAELMKAHAAVLRASIAEGGSPMWRAETLARAVALEGIAAQATATTGVLKLGNGGEVVVRVPIDAPWKAQEVCRATHDAPALVNAEASVERLEMARDVGALSLAVDAAERSGAVSPAEQMLAHQMAASHAIAMKLAAKAQAFLGREFQIFQRHVGDADGEARREQIASIEAARLATASARMMEATARAASALDRLKNGCTQTIVVQQKVDVQSGGQALVNGVLQVSPPSAKKRRKA